MADWVTISSLATGGGTLVLAIATFASVRSANRSARIAEQTLLEQRRPLLVQARIDDPLQKIAFADDHWVSTQGSQAVVEEADGNVYLVLSLRNVGAGIAVLQGWYPYAERQFGVQEHAELDDFRPHSRDLYVPPGDVGLWQGRLRDRDEQIWADLARAAHERSGFTIDLLYTDQTGGQRTISRFTLNPVSDEHWTGAVVRHWNLDAPGPR